MPADHPASATRSGSRPHRPPTRSVSGGGKRPQGADLNSSRVCSCAVPACATSRTTDSQLSPRSPGKAPGRSEQNPSVSVGGPSLGEWTDPERQRRREAPAGRGPKLLPRPLLRRSCLCNKSHNRLPIVSPITRESRRPFGTRPTGSHGGHHFVKGRRGIEARSPRVSAIGGNERSCRLVRRNGRRRSERRGRKRHHARDV